MKIGFRTIKTAVGSGLSIAVAQYLGLQFYAFAGILTILCLRETVKASFKDARGRFLACLIGMGYAAVIFNLFGYSPWTIALLLLFLLPTLVSFKIQSSVTSACVIILHMFTMEHVNWETVWNELQLISVGIGFALLMNLYMPNLEKELIRYQTSIEENFRKILHEVAHFLRDGESDWDGAEITETVQILKDAKAIALRDIGNQVLREETRYYRYFMMREKQFDIIERIMVTISPLTGSYVQGRQIADFLDELAEAIHPGNTTQKFLDQLGKLREDFHNSPLPRDREEFENRAALLHFVNDMERYLLTKKEFFTKSS